MLLPEVLDDDVADANPMRAVEVFVGRRHLGALGISTIEPALTGRPEYHPGMQLKLCIYGYLNRVQSSGRSEREAQRNATSI